MGITRLRVELKYRVPPARVPEVVGRMPEGKRRSYEMATTYLDRPDRSLSRTALATPFQSTKMRLREYRDEPGLVWMEIKTRQGAWTRKLRMRLRRESVGRLLAGELPPEAVPPQGAAPSVLHEASAMFRKIHEGGDGILVPLGCVQVARTMFSFGDPRVRVTLDERIAYYRAPGSDGEFHLPEADGWGEPLRSEPDCICEFKDNGTGFGWCRDVVADLAPTHYSKFLTLLDTLRPARESAHVD